MTKTRSPDFRGFTTWILDWLDAKEDSIFLKERNMSMPKIVVGNRFFEMNPDNGEKARAKLSSFIDNMFATGRVEKVVIAVNVAADKSGAMEFIGGMNDPNVVAIEVTPWGKFVPALSALLEYACMSGADGIFYASTELRIEQSALDALIVQVDDQTLVAGLRLEGHAFDPGQNECNGNTCPWNTAALWRVKDGLDRLGYPSIGEALFDPTRKNAGVEEVNAVNLYQKIYTDCGAKLIQASGTDWNTAQSNGGDAATFDWKMSKKYPRPEAQRAHAMLQAGKVMHIIA